MASTVPRSGSPMAADRVGLATGGLALPSAAAGHATSAPSGATADARSPFARLLRGLAAEVERGESLSHEAMGAARRRPDLSPAELLALQAGVFRYSEALDLASRLIDRSTSSVKTVLEGQ